MEALPDSLVRGLRGGGQGVGLLVVRLGAMGDILRTLPALRCLRGGLPDARIHWALDETWAKLLEDHPDVDALAVLPRKELGRLARGWKLGTLARSTNLWRRELRQLGVDLVLDFHGNLRSGIVGWFSGAPVRVGYAGHQQKEGNRWFTTHRVAAGDQRTPRPERNLDLVRALGLPGQESVEITLPLVDRGRERAHSIATAFAPRKPLAVVSPGASAKQAYKRPPTDLLAAACHRLADRDHVPLVVWGPGEKDAAEAVCHAEPTARLAPATDLATLAALIEGAGMFVGGDTGPLHMACAVGCPVLGLYGPTDPQVNRPWRVPYRTVYPPDRRYTGIKRIDRDSGGFTGLDARAVNRALDALLDEVASGAPARPGAP